MRLGALLVVLAALAMPSAASAHPLGNLSVNHVAEVSISADGVDVRYLLDQAEVPTFQERGVPTAEVIRRKRAEVLRRLRLTVDGRDMPLRVAGAPALSRPAGAGGLPTTRLELSLTAAVRSPRRVVVRDDTFAGRVGWRAVVARPGRGTAVRASVPVSDPTRGLRRYPQQLLESPADVREARFDVRPGDGVVTGSDGVRRAGTGQSGVGGAGRESGRAAEAGGFEGLVDDAAAGRGVLVLLLLAAFGWGAVHALSPGHGKAMVAAYLVGTRGTARHAVALGLTVTATHTAGVFALGFVTLALSEHVLPETLFPWLNLASGLLVVGVGFAVLRSHLRRRKAHAHHHHHHHTHDHPTGWRGVLAMGAAAGLIPCPSALVVLLGAVAQGEVALGMLLIVAFSAGLAATLTALGMAVVLASRAIGRLRVPRRVVTALPVASAALIVGVGFVLTARALPLVA